MKLNLQQLILTFKPRLTLNKLMYKKLLILLFVFFTVNANADDVTAKEFADRIKKCTESIYSNIEEFPPHKQVPVELIIAQGAHESAWGNSRFAKEGNNLFGVRTYDPQIPQIKAKGAPNAKWGLRKYDNWCHSVRDYLDILNNHPRYENFREELKFQTETGTVTPIQLILHLGAWSEQGDKYIRLLQDIMLGLYQKDFFKNIG